MSDRVWRLQANSLKFPTQRLFGHLSMRNCTRSKTNMAKSLFSFIWNTDCYLLKLLKWFFHALAFLVYFLNICVWTKGEAAIGEVSPAPWKLRRSFVPLLPAAAAVHLDCIWLSVCSFLLPKKEAQLYGRIKGRRGRLNLSHFTLSFSKCVRVAACLKHLKSPLTPHPLFSIFGW